MLLLQKTPLNFSKNDVITEWDALAEAPLSDVQYSVNVFLSISYILLLHRHICPKRHMTTRSKVYRLCLLAAGNSILPNCCCHRSIMTDTSRVDPCPVISVLSATYAEASTFFQVFAVTRQRLINIIVE